MKMVSILNPGPHSLFFLSLLVEGGEGAAGRVFSCLSPYSARIPWISSCFSVSVGS
jgi:hypothetical protein